MPTMFHAKPSAMARHRAKVDLATKSAKRAATPKPTDYSDHLRWGGSLVDPAWLKANGMDSRECATVRLPEVIEPERMIEAAAKEALNEAFDPAYILGDNCTHAEVDSVSAIETILGAVLDEFKPEENTEDGRIALERRLSKPLREAMLLMRSAAHDAVDRFLFSDKGGTLDMQELAASQWHHGREYCPMEFFEITSDDVCALVADSDHHTIQDIITENQNRVS